MSGTTRPSSRAEARQLVQSIARQHGHIRQEVLDRMSDADRREVEEAMQMKDGLIASSVVTLARNLYTSNARCVFELLQNAEDNHFIQARAHGEMPNVSFSLYLNQLVLECNEDGFTERNLRAICNVGQSSKTDAQGYIGEKGIGFKSVFMAAYRVHVQSGHFSFHFLHRQGDSGMGMITPVWEEDAEYLGDQRTRITLDLQQGGTPEEQATRNQAIRDQLLEIHDEILLFMKKIQEIKIMFYDCENGETGEPIRTITHSINRQDTRAVCQKHTSDMGRERTCRRFYHITKHTARGLAKAPGRTYTKSEETSKAYSEGEVVLAFPLTKDSVPVLERQWLFAFLPVRQMGFKFLIQADFVTQANRQDIVTTSPRNQGLATGVADAFIKGVLQLCNHQTLQYQWMRYLPEENAYPWDHFWKEMMAKIKERITTTPILRPAVPGPLRMIRNSRRHRLSHLDASGQPLLPDVDPGLYLSLQYQNADLRRLDGFGLDAMFMAEIIERARADLATPVSRMRTMQDEDWHSRVADLLRVPFTNGWADRCRDVMWLDLLPLRDGVWTSSMFGPVYHSKVEGTDLDIPPGLPFKVIDPRASNNASRKQLFDAVGVQHAPVSIVRAAVLTRCHNGQPTLQESVSYLRFLYLSESFTSHPYSYGRLRIYSHRGQLEDTAKVDVYLPDDEDPYGATQLLRPTSPGPGAGCGAPGFDVLFAHEEYFQDSPSDPPGCRWEWWIGLFCGLRQWVPLTTDGDDETREITPVCGYVAQYRPEKYLGLLQANWEQHGLECMEADSAIIQKLGRVPVLCQGSGINLRPLSSTYLPIGELVTLCSRFMLDGEVFPWLMLETPLDNDTALTEWSYLGSAFGLGYNRQLLDFALAVLKFVLDANPLARDLRHPERMYALYGYLQAKVDESSDVAECQDKIRTTFASRSFIFVPQGKTHRRCWVKPERCLWSAPIPMRTKYTLARVYAEEVSSNRDLSRLKTFFTHTLEIPSCTWEDIVEEIRSCKTQRGITRARARELYGCLFDMRLIGISARDLRRTFESEALICGFDESWYTAPDCLWSSATTIRGKLILNDLYNDLEDFFVGILGVSELTAELVYEKLTSQDGPELSVNEAKESLVAFNSFLTIGSGDFDSTPVLENRVFPVRFPSGEVMLRAGTEGFALMDRKSLGEDFATLAKFLDFGMDEVLQLQPLIQWAGLGDRYLSKSVKEISCADKELTRPISSARRDIRGKAHALLRIAVTYNSPRTLRDQNEFYILLQNSETLEAGKITAELLLRQNDEVLRVEKNSASLHICEGTDGLRVYVPRDNRSQEVCFHSKLPRRLCEWMMTDPTTEITQPVSSDTVAVVQSVLSAQSFALDGIMDEHGIMEVDIANGDFEIPVAEDEDASIARASSPATVPVEANNSDPPRPETPPPRRYAQTESSSDDSLGSPTPLSSVASPEVIAISYVAARSSHAASRPRLRPMDAYGIVQEDQYASLLRKVVRAARHTTFPSQGTFDMSALHAALPGVPADNDAAAEAYRLRSTSQIERDKRIGAAGELFVFEMLLRLQPGLPGFSREDWQSTIRGYAAAHPDYSDLAAWVGRETADITYSDFDEAFTRLLIDKGYLASETWVDARPHYLIEVKTTTGSCSTPFFMSKYQYRRMQRNSNHDNDNLGTVYVVFRVFNLGNDNIGLRVLVDPESMRLQDELSFTAESWSVVAAE